jgi:DNA-binding LytR/AlgR family response regulator
LYYNCNGGLDFWQVAKGFQPFRLKQEIRDLPVENYDLVINDFDYITAAACAKKKVPSVNFGHQASFQSMLTPRPSAVSAAGEWVLKNYARATRYIGLHFRAYDNFILNAFESNGIDYLLKPVDQKDIEKTLEKYRTLKDHFDNHRSFINSFYKKQKTRLLVRKGIENIILRTSDIVIIYTENKLVYVIDKDGKKYIADKNLSDIDEELDPGVFFRVNRQYIINIGFVKGYKAYEKVKLQIDLTMPELQHQIIVSQEMAPCFRKWISGL